MQQVLSVLTPGLRAALSGFQKEWEQLEEIRLCQGKRPLLRFRDRDQELVYDGIALGEMEQILELASRASLHTVLPQLRQGYLTIRGGHRLGICGSIDMREGQIHGILALQGLNFRLARQQYGVGEGVVPQLCPKGVFESSLILAPPGGGKTTLLRDVIRCLSDGINCRAHRVSLVDERGEVAALVRGMPQLDVGKHTNVMEGCPKAKALMLMLRGMNPQVLAADEITAVEDIRAMETAAGCGVSLLCTAHGKNRKDILNRKLYQEMLDSGIFKRIVTIYRVDGQRLYEVEELG